MHWHIVGTGAIGCLFATRLAQQGTVTLLPHRAPDTPGPISVRVSGLSGDREHPLPWEPVEAPGAISHLLVTTKAYDVAGALDTISHRLRGDSVVLLMANGLGYAEELQRRLPWLQPALGTTTEGAFRQARWHIHHAGRGTTRIGQPASTGPAPAWFDNWRQAVPDCHWDKAIEDALWRKLAINCAINPLTALQRCQNGQLAREPDLAANVRALCREIATVAEAAGHGRAVADLEADVFAVIRGTADNRSSMLQDVEAGRRTEIDYITGHLVATAEARGIEAPLNRGLLDRVHALENEADTRE